VENVNVNFAVNKAANKSIRLFEEEGSSPTTQSPSTLAAAKLKDEAPVASKDSKPAEGKPFFVSPEAKNKSKSSKNAPIGSRTAQQKKELFSPLFTKENPKWHLE
jgi:hypothetical protein